MNPSNETIKKYNKIKLVTNILESVIFILLLVVLVFTDFSFKLKEVVISLSGNSYLRFLIFCFLLGIIELIITFPLDFYTGYVIEHRYSLSNQTLKGFFVESSKSIFVSILILTPLLLVFFFLLRNFQTSWWLPVGIVTFLFTIVLSKVAPILIFPLFYTFKPIENEDLKKKLGNLCDKAGISFDGIFSFNLSKNTKKGNAGFTGFGKNKRIIISDTILDNFNIDEIGAIFAHEIGHYKLKHIWKGIIAGGIITFAGLYIVNKLLLLSLDYFNFTGVDDIAAFPIIVLYLVLFSILLLPLNNALSRKHEKDADKFSVELIENSEPFISSMNKLVGQNLADPEPNPVIEFIFYSHPSVNRRIELIKTGRNSINGELIRQ